MGGRREGGSLNRPRPETPRGACASCAFSTRAQAGDRAVEWEGRGRGECSRLGREREGAGGCGEGMGRGRGGGAVITSRAGLAEGARGLWG